MGDTRQPEPGHVEPAAPAPEAKAPWIPPALVELPRLTDLTLQTGGSIHGGGDTGGAGSTVF
jgi:hypothetical protein